MSLPKLADRAGYSRGYLLELSAGKNSKQPSSELTADLDQALQGDGTLILAWEEGDDDMHRRDVLRDLSALALARDTLAAVPEPDHKLGMVTGLHERLALPAGRP